MASEKRLIYLQDAVKLLRGKCVAKYPNSFLMGLLASATEIEQMPTVDAVEVVRCKDCRWARPQDNREPTETPKQMIICQCFMNHHIPAPWGARLAVNPEHFCSYGERKDNERKAD